MLQVGDVPAEELDLRGYRQRVAFVPQEAILLGGDLRSNIRYGRPDATDEVIDAAKRGFAWNFIQDFPEACTPSSASAVCSVRRPTPTDCHCPAILKDPDLLILDEATSALDSTSERRLPPRRTDERPQFRGHRPPPKHREKRHAHLRDGRRPVVEEGKHEELRAGGHYAQLVKNQELAG